jgi:hypothetical protein
MESSMSKLELPETVRQAWGLEVAQDFTQWLAEQLDAVSLPPFKSLRW